MANSLERKFRRLKAPSSWRIGLRRGFVVTFPISIPLWAVTVLGLGLLVGIREAFEPLAGFWSDPPKRLPNSNYQSYGSRSNRDKVVPLPGRKDHKDAA